MRAGGGRVGWRGVESGGGGISTEPLMGAALLGAGARGWVGLAPLSFFFLRGGGAAGVGCVEEGRFLEEVGGRPWASGVGGVVEG